MCFDRRHLNSFVTLDSNSIEIIVVAAAAAAALVTTYYQSAWNDIREYLCMCVCVCGWFGLVCVFGKSMSTIYQIKLLKETIPASNNQLFRVHDIYEHIVYKVEDFIYLLSCLYHFRFVSLSSLMTNSQQLMHGVDVDSTRTHSN